MNQNYITGKNCSWLSDQIFSSLFSLSCISHTITSQWIYSSYTKLYKYVRKVFSGQKNY